MRCAVPLPSARCLKIPRSDSRSDWNASHWLSGDQIGNRFRPPKVKRRGADEPDSSYTHTVTSPLSSVLYASVLPSGEMRGYAYELLGNLSGCTPPERSN